MLNSSKVVAPDNGPIPIPLCYHPSPPEPESILAEGPLTLSLL